MTLKRLLLAAAFALVAAPLLVVAQARRPPGVPDPNPTPDPTVDAIDPKRPARSTDPRADIGKLMGVPSTDPRSISGEVVRVDLDAGTILVTDPKKGVHGTFHVSRKTKLSADKETTLGGKKKLTLEDFQQGQTVKVTYWVEEDADWSVRLRALEVRARRPKN
jgi:hypothetical protein